MSPVLVGVLIFAVMLVLFFIGVPVGAAMSAVGIGGMIIMLGFDSAILKVGLSPFSTMYSYSYAVMPLFILMANIISETGIGANLYDFFYKTVGRFKGGMAIATVFACAIFAAVSSATAATAITIGLIALPEMRKMRYSDKLATGAIAAGGTLGIMIPPSGILLLYGIMAEVSISKLFVAGIIPGIILVVLYSIGIVISCKRDPAAGPRGPKFRAREIWQALKGCLPVVLLIIIVLGGMFAGLFTPTESAGIGAIGAVVITLVGRKLTLSRLWNALKGTMRSVGMIYSLLIGSALLNFVFTLSGMPNALANWVGGLGINRIAVMAIIIIIYLLLGCVMDSLAMILLTVPVFLPLVLSLDFDPIWFGVVITLCVQMAAITPPVGINVFVTKGLDENLSISTVFSGVWPYVFADLICAALLIAFPSLVTFIPGLM